VASARPSVQVYENIQDVMLNESDNSEDESSSDADDEGEDEEDPDHVSPSDSMVQAKKDGSPDKSIPAPLVLVGVAGPAASASSTEESRQPSPTQSISLRQSISLEPLSSSVGGSGSLPSVPPSPGLPALPANSPSLTPPEGWAQSIRERNSFMKAISGIWNQQIQPTLPKYITDSFEDIGVDPVHIHRDSPIALRTDEPTSIIAVALRYDTHR